MIVRAKGKKVNIKMPSSSATPLMDNVRYGGNAVDHADTVDYGTSSPSSSKNLLGGIEDDDGSSSGDEHAKKWWARGFCPRPRLLRTVDVQDTDYEKERDITWSELFFDLIFVVAIARLGENLREKVNESLTTTWYSGLGDYSVYFVTLIHIWWNLAQYCTRYGTDDMYHKLFIPTLMMGVVFQCALSGGGPSDANNSSGFAYATAFTYVMQSFLWWRIVYHLKSPMRMHALIFGVVPDTLSCLAFVFIGYSVPFSSRMTAIAVAFVCRMLHVWLYVSFVPCLYPQTAQAYPAPCHKRFFCMKAKPKFTGCLPSVFVPLHLEHFTERVGCLAIIVLGEMIDDITEATEQKHTTSYFYACALCFAIIVMFKLIIFDTDEGDIERHALRRDRLAGICWGMLNFPKMMAIAIMGSAMSMFCASFKSDLLSSENVGAARTLLCGSAAIILAITSIDTFLHEQHWNNVEQKNNGMSSYLLQKLHRVYFVQMSASFVAVASLFYLARTDAAIISDVKLLAAIFIILAFIVALGFLDEYVEVTHTGCSRSELLRRQKRRRSSVASGMYMPAAPLS